jgi:hypothetical protein
LATIEEPDEDEAKELYAHFGLAYYCANVLEHGIVNALCYIDLLDQRKTCRTRQEWERMVDAHFDNSFSQTFGRLKSQIAGHAGTVPDIAALMGDLEACAKERNFLAHHFWREYGGHWFSKAGRAAMVARLKAARDMFFDTTARLDAAVEPFAERHGLSKDVREHELEIMKRAMFQSATE